MNYEFPRIVHIQQILDAVKGDEDLFYVVEKDGYTVINYKSPCNKTFPAVVNRDTAIRRELRGIKFCSVTGEILSRPFQKFFNYMEREETLGINVDISKSYDRLEKLDGSMVHPIKINGVQRWCTKMGITDISMQVETWLVQNHFVEITEFANDMHDDGFTPIFEWCSRANRIVVDHPVDRLVLTAVRNTIEGEYLSYNDLQRFGEGYGFEIVKRETTPIKDMESYSNSIYEISNGDLTEGEVLRFCDGHMLKLKTQEYVNLHRTKDKIQKERHFVAVLLSGGLDDLKPFMLAEDLTKAEIYESQLNKNIRDIESRTVRLINRIRAEEMSRKDFAINSQAEPLIKQIVFYLWDKSFETGITVYEEIMSRLTDAVEHEQKFEKLRPYLLKECIW